MRRIQTTAADLPVARQVAAWLAAGLSLLLALVLALSSGLMRHAPGGSGERLGLPYDFAAAVYFPTRAFLDGVCPYGSADYLARYPAPSAASPYLPGALLLHLPFALLPPQTAAAVYTAFSVGLTVLLAYVALAMSEVKARGPLVLLFAAVLIISRPGRTNLLQGQIALQMVLAGYVALACARDRPWASGVGLAVTMLKPTFGIPLALLMLARRDTRAVLRGAAVTAAVNLPVLAILVYEAGGIRALSDHLVHTVAGLQGMTPDNDPVLSPSRVDLVALVSRVAGRRLGAVAQVVVGGAVVGLAALALRRIGCRRPSEQMAISAGIICTAVLLSVYHQPFDLLFLALPFALAASRRLPPPYDARAYHWPMLALFAILAFNYAAGGSVLSRFGLVIENAGHSALAHKPLAVIVGSLNGLALLALLAGYAAVAFRRPATAAQR